MKFPWVRDELILALDLYFQFGILDHSNIAVRELSTLLRTFELHSPTLRDDNFRSPSSVALKLANLANHDPDFKGKTTNGSILDGQVYAEWADRKEELRRTAEAIAKAASVPGSGAQEFEEEFEAPEGRLLTSQYFKRERNQALRTKKIQQAVTSNAGIRCEVCLFDFGATYGSRGVGYIECHHVTPLHVSGEVTTKLADLVLLCSNCHRMIHRNNPWLTPQELRDTLSTSSD